MTTNDKTKCPQCGGKVRMDGRACICNRCGYIYMPQNAYQDNMQFSNQYHDTKFDQSQANGTQQQYQQQPYQQQKHYQNQQQTNGPVYMSSNLGSMGMPNVNVSANHKVRVKNPMGTVVMVIICAILLILGMLGVLGIIAVKHVYDKKTAQTEQSSVEEALTSAGENDGYGEEYSEEMIYDLGYDIMDAEDTVLEELVGYAFGKSLENVTQEELNSVLEIDFDSYGKDSYIVDYYLEDGTKGNFLTFYEEVPVNLLPCFPYIEALDLQKGRIRGDELCDLQNLYSLYAQFEEEPSEVCNPEQIIYLGIYDKIGIPLSEDSLEPFESLEMLTMGCDNIRAFSCLSSVTDLKSLVIIDADQIEDFSVLYDMTELEYLYIQSKRLKDIGFVAYMPNLTGIGLENTKVLNIDALESLKDQLISLYLINNNELKGCDFLSEMTNLENLELTRFNNTEQPESQIPDLSNMTELRTLTLEGFDDFTSVEKLTQLEYLSIERPPYGKGLPQIRELDNLTYLKLLDGSITPDMVDDITATTSIRSLDLSGTYIWGDISGIMNMPNLLQLDLKDVDCGMMFDRLEQNESLSYLNMEGTRFAVLDTAGNWDYKIDEDYALDEHLDMFSNYPNLRYLSIPSHNITSVDFVSDLYYLEWLDIKDNYVTDLTPIHEMPYSCAVYYENNPIAKGLE